MSGRGVAPEMRSLLTRLERHLAQANLPLLVADVQPARDQAQALAQQLRDYVVPRLESELTRPAPLLVVVGGPTGAGKSTIVNSLVGHVVSRAGVLRPTTRNPVLLHHPDDTAVCAGHHFLADAPRMTAGPGQSSDQPDLDLQPVAITLVADSAVPPGLAILDAPDVDSIITNNRRLSAQLLAAADVWLFVTTANRYADAVQWQVLDAGVRSGVSTAVVINRIPPDSLDEVQVAMVELMCAHGLASSPLFAIAEMSRTGAGLIPVGHLRALGQWLQQISSDSGPRHWVVQRTLTGVIAALPERLAEVVDVAVAQETALQYLREDVQVAFAHHREWLGRTLAVRPIQVSTLDRLGSVIAAAARRAIDGTERAWRARPYGVEWAQQLHGGTGDLGQPIGSAAQVRSAVAETIAQWRSTHDVRPGHTIAASARADLADSALRVLDDYERRLGAVLDQVPIPPGQAAELSHLLGKLVELRQESNGSTTRVGFNGEVGVGSSGTKVAA